MDREEQQHHIPTPPATAVKVPDGALTTLAESIASLVDKAKRDVVRNVNHTMVHTYWHIGRHIVEFEQKGNAKAEYGTRLLTNLSHILRAKLGKGYSRPNLNNMRKFYALYPICQTVSDKYICSTGLRKQALKCAHFKALFHHSREIP